MIHAVFAYLDPGTGSFVIQAIAGAVVGAGLVIKTFWGRIRATLTRKTNDNSD